MGNLFEIFDPTTSFSLPINWLALITCLACLNTSLWISITQSTFLLNQTLRNIHQEFFTILSNNSPPGSLLIPLTLLVTIGLNNLFGLLPYIFTSTSHLTIAASLALPLWVGYSAISWTLSTLESLAHLVPTGTPPALIPFMVLIELVSSLIRPITLSVRLAANIVAGHLLLTLLSNQASPLNPPLTVAVGLTLLPLLFLESAVALVQSYVFSILSTLYLSEIAHPSLSFFPQFR